MQRFSLTRNSELLQTDKSRNWLTFVRAKEFKAVQSEARCCYADVMREIMVRLETRPLLVDHQEAADARHISRPRFAERKCLRGALTVAQEVDAT